MTPLNEFRGYGALALVPETPACEPTDHMDLAECFEDIKDFELLMRELADFNDGLTKPEQLREFLESKLTFLRAERSRG